MTLQLADYEGERVLSCVSLLLLQVLLPFSGEEGREEDAEVGEGQRWQVQAGHG